MEEVFMHTPDNYEYLSIILCYRIFVIENLSMKLYYKREKNCKNIISITPTYKIFFFIQTCFRE